MSRSAGRVRPRVRAVSLIYKFHNAFLHSILWRWTIQSIHCHCTIQCPTRVRVGTGCASELECRPCRFSFYIPSSGLPIGPSTGPSSVQPGCALALVVRLVSACQNSSEQSCEQCQTTTHAAPLQCTVWCGDVWSVCVMYVQYANM